MSVKELADRAAQRPRHADHRLRRAGARDHGTAPRQRLGRAGRALPAGRTAQSARKDSRRRSRTHPFLARALPFDLRRLRRLRHGRIAGQGACARRASNAFPGAHCYEFFATGPVFAALAEAEPGTFYLTDFLLRHFERLVIRGLGLDRHPELFSAYFGNYRKLVYLAQAPDAHSQARGARDRARAWGCNSNIARPATGRWGRRWPRRGPQ